MQSALFHMVVWRHKVRWTIHTQAIAHYFLDVAYENLSSGIFKSFFYLEYGKVAFLIKS